MTDSLQTKRKSQMSDKERIQDFQRKLYRKAKQEKEFRFYYDVPGVSYPAKAKRDLRWYLMHKLQRYYKRKSQRASRLYRRNVFEVLVSRCGLIDPTKMTRSPAPVKAFDEACRKAVCGKTACTV